MSRALINNGIPKKTGIWILTVKIAHSNKINEILEKKKTTDNWNERKKRWCLITCVMWKFCKIYNCSEKKTATFGVVASNNDKWRVFFIFWEISWNSTFLSKASWHVLGSIWSGNSFSSKKAMVRELRENWKKIW